MKKRLVYEIMFSLFGRIPLPPFIERYSLRKQATTKISEIFMYIVYVESLYRLNCFALEKKGVQKEFETVQI